MIEIKCDICTLQLKNHVTLLGSEDGVVFDSATHKTHLFKLLQQQQTSKRLVCTKNVRFVSDPYVLHDLTLSSSDCIIIDEFNYAPSEFSDLLLEVRRANAWLVVIGRLFIKQLEYSVDSILVFHMDESNHVTFNEYFQNAERLDLAPDIVACEDSTMVAAIYSTVLETNVEPASSRSSFFKTINENELPFIIADKSKFGADLLNLIYLIKNKNNNIKFLILFCSACFEEILCEVTGLDVGSVENALEHTFDSEKFYETAANALPMWSKQNVTKSLIALQREYTFSRTTSSVLNDLFLFYNNECVLNPSRCYVINIDNITIKDEKDYLILKNDNIAKSADNADSAKSQADTDTPKLMLV